MKKILVLLVVVLFLCGGSIASAVTVGGIDFDDNAWVDTVIDSSGGWFWGGGSWSALLDSDTSQGVALYDGDYVEFGFTDNYAVNYAGADLAIFEAGSPAEDFIVSVSLMSDGTGWTSTIQYSTVYTGYSSGGYNLNVTQIDISDFGISYGASISSVRIDGVTHSSAGGTDLSAVGALYTETAPVPEPASMLLLGSGLIGLVGFRKRFVKS